MKICNIFLLISAATAATVIDTQDLARTSQYYQRSKEQFTSTLELRRIQQQVGELQNQVQAWNDKINFLRSQMNNLNRQIIYIASQIQDAQNETTFQEKNLTAAERDLSQQTQANNILEETLQNLKDQYLTFDSVPLVDQINSISVNINATEGANAESLNQLGILMVKYGAYEKQIKSLFDHQFDYQIKFNELMDKIAALRAENAEMDDFNVDLDALRATFESVSQDNYDMDRMLQDDRFTYLEGKIKNTELLIKSNVEKLEDLNNSIASLRADLDNLGNLTQNVRDARAENKRLQNVLVGLLKESKDLQVALDRSIVIRNQRNGGQLLIGSANN